MNCTIWRSTSVSAPFSASSVNAIVAVVIVEIFLDRMDHDGHPDRGRLTTRQAASDYALRA